MAELDSVFHVQLRGGLPVVGGASRFFRGYEVPRGPGAVWGQERLAGRAREIAALGKELYVRMSVMGWHIARVGKNLDQATGAYNAFVGSFESQVLTQAKWFETLDVETGDKEIPVLPVAEQTARPLAKLAAAPAGVNDANN